MMITSLYLVLRFICTITLCWCLLASVSSASFIGSTSATIRTSNVAGTPSSCPSSASGWNWCSKRLTYDCRYLNSMPLDDYRDTVSSLESVLEQVQESLTVSQDLIRRLVALHNHALDDAPLDSYYNNDDFIPRDPQRQPLPPQLPLSLQTALERARSTSQHLGRNALETEWAWWQVRQVAASIPKYDDNGGNDDDTLSQQQQQQQQSSRICPALLAHPSYRDSYGEFLLQRYPSDNNNNNRENGDSSIVNSNNNNNHNSDNNNGSTTTTTTRQQLQIHAQTLQQSLQQLQSTVQDEAMRLRDIEQRRAIRIKKLNQTFY